MDHVKASPRAMSFLLFLTLLNILNMVDRTLITSFGTAIITDLELSDPSWPAHWPDLCVLLFHYGPVYGRSG